MYSVHPWALHTSRHIQLTLPAADAWYPVCRAVQARGAGYAMSTANELQLVADVAAATGVILDPV